MSLLECSVKKKTFFNAFVRLSVRRSLSIRFVLFDGKIAYFYARFER